MHVPRRSERGRGLCQQQPGRGGGSVHTWMVAAVGRSLASDMSTPDEEERDEAACLDDGRAGESDCGVSGMSNASWEGRNTKEYSSSLKVNGTSIETRAVPYDTHARSQLTVSQKSTQGGGKEGTTV